MTLLPIHGLFLMLAGYYPSVLCLSYIPPGPVSLKQAGFASDPFLSLPPHTIAPSAVFCTQVHLGSSPSHLIWGKSFSLSVPTLA